MREMVSINHAAFGCNDEQLSDVGTWNWEIRVFICSNEVGVCVSESRSMGSMPSLSEETRIVVPLPQRRALHVFFWE